MRSLLLLVVLAGCQASQSDALTGGDDSGAPPFAECVTAEDCVLAASSCCGCPEFAMPDRGWQDGCDDVECEPEDAPGCAAVTAACVTGVCTVACQPVTCELSCDAGFAVDATGCQVCACGGAADAPECEVDADCVEVPADCCGCGRGGADTAVPVGLAGSHGDLLDCPDDPGEAACPEVDVCDPAEAPRCIAGQCALATDDAPGEPVAACGRPDLPPCPEGFICVLNSDPDASMQGLGTCQSI